MATVKFTPNGTIPAYNMVQARLDFPNLLNGYNQATLNSSEISLRDDAANRTVIYGDDIAFKSEGGKLVLTGGIITSIDVRIGSTTPVLEIDNLNIRAADFGDLLGAGSVNLYDLMFAGNDTISGANGNDFLKGFVGNDRLNGLDGVDTLYGDQGNDQLYGGGGNDAVSGGVGDDSVYGEVGDDSVNGGDGNDQLWGGVGNDRIDGGVGNDQVWGGAGNDATFGGTGDDRIFGEDGNDNIQGGDGKDALNGGNQNDAIFGQNGNDGLDGAAGNDVLNGGVGLDSLKGGTGSDVFVFDAPVVAGNADFINDFNVAADTIHLQNAVFVGLPNGVLSASRFVSNNSGNAQDSSDRVIYEKDTGKLFFDRDGTGTAHSKVLFATLDDGLSVTSADFFVI